MAMDRGNARLESMMGEGAGAIDEAEFALFSDMLVQNSIALGEDMDQEDKEEYDEAVKKLAGWRKRMLDAIKAGTVGTLEDWRDEYADSYNELNSMVEKQAQKRAEEKRLREEKEKLKGEEKAKKKAEEKAKKQAERNKSYDKWLAEMKEKIGDLQDKKVKTKPSEREQEKLDTYLEAGAATLNEMHNVTEELADGDPSTKQVIADGHVLQGFVERLVKGADKALVAVDAESQKFQPHFCNGSVRIAQLLTDYLHAADKPEDQRNEGDIKAKNKALKAAIDELLEEFRVLREERLDAKKKRDVKRRERKVEEQKKKEEDRKKKEADKTAKKEETKQKKEEDKKKKEEDKHSKQAEKEEEKKRRAAEKEERAREREEAKKNKKKGLLAMWKDQYHESAKATGALVKTPKSPRGGKESE